LSVEDRVERGICASNGVPVDFDGQPLNVDIDIVGQYKLEVAAEGELQFAIDDEVFKLRNASKFHGGHGFGEMTLEPALLRKIGRIQKIGVFLIRVREGACRRRNDTSSGAGRRLP